MKVNSAVALTALLSAASALELDVSDVASVKGAAQKIATKLVSYTLDETYLLPLPYYFWTTGLFLDTLLSYARLTRDRTTFPPSRIEEALTFQVGDDNFMPTNQTKSMGNDDQSYWALAAMTGIENEMLSDSAKWEKVLENVWNSQARRWDEATCGGGLRWQIFSFNKGYDYKNSQSNMNFFLLSARLAAYTDNSTYSEWATKVYDWSVETGLIGEDSEVFDGATTGSECTEIDHLQWSANSATAAYGAAIMSKLDKDTDAWASRASGILAQFTRAFTDKSVLVESACEERETCNPDTKNFKGIAVSHLTRMAALDPASAESIAKIMEASAKAAAASCEDDGTCGMVWTEGSFDGDEGVGQQMNTLNVVAALLAPSAAEPMGTANATESQSETDVTQTAGGSVAEPTGSASGIAAAGGAANATSTAPATGAASLVSAVGATWAVGALALGVAALL